MTARSHLVRVRPKSDSFRVTLPAAVMEVLGLKEGDEIEWEFKAEGGGIVVNVRPVRAVGNLDERAKSSTRKRTAKTVDSTGTSPAAQSG